MQEIKEIILSRIKDIIELEQLEQKQIGLIQSRYDTVIKQKKGQQLRNIKQSHILASLDTTNFQCKSLYTYILPIVLQICTSYDPSIKIQQQVDPKMKLYKLLKIFFINNDFKQKNSILKAAFMRPYASVTSGIIFSWLSEWSKKKYLSILNLQIKNIKQRFVQNKNLLHQLTIQRHRSISNINNLQGLRFSSSKKIEIQTQTACTSQAQQNSFSTIDKSQKFISASVGQINSAKILTIYNRLTLYGYIAQQMYEYYKLTGIDQLDKNYVKSIRKRKLKEHLPLKQNLTRATEVIIESSTNKQLRNLMKKYQTQYNSYKQQKQKLLVPKKIQKQIKQGNKSIKKIQKIPNEKMKTENIYHSTQKKRQFSQKLQQSSELNIQLTRIRSSSLFEMQTMNQEKINAMRIQIKKQLINKLQSNRNSQRKQYPANTKLPNISKSAQKQQKSYEQIGERIKILRFSTQEDQQIETSNQNESKANLPRFKFNQRQTIKGIIIKNFLSNRQKLQRNKQKEEEEKKKQLVFLTGQTNKKVTQGIQQQSKRVIQSTDIRSLRHKTNAILRNLRTIQHY